MTMSTNSLSTAVTMTNCYHDNLKVILNNQKESQYSELVKPGPSLCHNEKIIGPELAGVRYEQMSGTSIFRSRRAIEDPESGASLNLRKGTGETRRAPWFLLVLEHPVATNPEAMAQRTGKFGLLFPGLQRGRAAE